MNEIFETADGSKSLISTNFGVSYHSKHGAIQETAHVFINAALEKRGKEIDLVNLLDIGFGTGLNALMAYQWANQHKKKVIYTGIEAYPISMETAMDMDYPKALNAEVELKEVFEKMHAAESNQIVDLSPYFQFNKIISTFEELNESEQYDVIFFDAFAPNAQPDLWETELLSKMYQALKPEGVMTTYCAKGQVKRNLKSLGFKLEALPGPPGKREMTRVTK
jgi:tRNA U34 5-methylaminomethyl-2-thiouridine-forming methyltransferase MnmC